MENTPSNTPTSKHVKGDLFVSGYQIVAMPSQTKIANHIDGDSFEQAKANRDHIVRCWNSNPKLIKELIRLNGRKPIHPLDKDSTFHSKQNYDLAYKAWNRTNDIINEALGNV